MPTFKLHIAYEGTNYVGWQRQANGVSVQGLIEQACEPLAGRAVAVAGAGRTDAGVHALGQAASMSFDTSLAPWQIRRAVNYRLPEDIRVLRVEEAPETFHARFHSTGKRYRYRIATGSVPSPLDRRFTWHAPWVRDVADMRHAAAAFIGRHDFASFQPAGTEVESTVRTIRTIEIADGPCEDIAITIEGDGFLRHMVRTIVGTLADVGAAKCAWDRVPGILAACDRRAAGRTAPAHGLTLLDVLY